MAVIVNPNQNEDNNQQDGQQQTQLTQNAGGQGGTAAPQPSQQQRQGSGRFTNLQKYLGANQQAGGRVAGQIGQNIQEDIGEQKKQAQDYYANLGKSIDQSKQSAQQGEQYINQMRQTGQQLQDQGLLAQAPQINNLQDYRNIQQGRGINENVLQSQAGSLGETSQGYLQGAQGALENLQSEGGRFNLLRQAFGGQANPEYTRGQQRLDQLFLSQEGLGGVMGDVYQDVEAGQQLQREAGQLGQQAQSLIGQEQAIMSELGQQAQSNVGTYQDLLNEQVSQAQERAATEIPELRRALDEGRITQQQASQLGLDDVSDLYTVNLSDYLSTAPQANLQNVTSQEQAAQFRALQNLMGENQQDVFGDQAEFGTYQPAQFDSETARRLIGEQGERYNTTKQNILNQIQALQGVVDRGRRFQDYTSESDVSGNPLFNFYRTIENTNVGNFGQRDLETITDFFKQGVAKKQGYRDQSEQAAMDFFLNNQGQINEFNRLNTGRQLQQFTPEDLETLETDTFNN